MHAETISVVHAEKLQWICMIYGACVLYCMSVDIGCPAPVRTIQRCGHTAHSELPRSVGLTALVWCSTASAGMHNVVKVSDGNISFPLKEVDGGRGGTQQVIFASILV